jgi:hypothetical protein
LLPLSTKDYPVVRLDGSLVVNPLPSFGLAAFNDFQVVTPIPLAPSTAMSDLKSIASTLFHTPVRSSLTSLLYRAACIADLKSHGQYDKGGSTKYICFPERLYKILYTSSISLNSIHLYQHDAEIQYADASSLAYRINKCTLFITARMLMQCNKTVESSIGIAFAEVTGDVLNVTVADLNSKLAHWV